VQCKNIHLRFETHFLYLLEGDPLAVSWTFCVTMISQ